MLADTLIVIDLQNGIVGNHPDLPAFLTRINQHILEYRKAGKLILFIQHNDQAVKYGTAAWQLVTGLDRQQTDIVIEKCHPNAFLQTDLLFQLNTRQLHTIEICGAQTEYCVDATIKGAHTLGYQVYMQHQMNTTDDNTYMTATQTVAFYEHIWEQRFVTFID